MTKGVKPISYRQIKALELWIADGFKSKARAIRGAGYGKTIARKPHKVFTPMVLEELEKRGYDVRGNRFPPRAVDLTEYLPPEPSPIDFTKMGREWMQELKERLEAVDGMPLRFSNPREQDTDKVIYSTPVTGNRHSGDNLSLSSF